jgi:hypothetical protein
MVTLEPKAWTLLGSFVNTDKVVSWGGSRNGNWTNKKIFGQADKADLADFKSGAWSEVAGTELLIEDRSKTLLRISWYFIHSSFGEFQAEEL